MLRERSGRLAGSLSGGQQQQVAIARALMSEPELLLLDEPSLGLSPQVVDVVFETIATLRERGMTMLLVEQDVAEALAIADRCRVLASGRITRSGTPRRSATTSSSSAPTSEQRSRRRWIRWFRRSSTASRSGGRTRCSRSGWRWSTR